METNLTNTTKGYATVYSEKNTAVIPGEGSAGTVYATSKLYPFLFGEGVDPTTGRAES